MSEPAVTSRWSPRPVVQLAGFLRKEVATLARQPRLLVVLVVGPFLILLLFAAGYDQEQVVLRTSFVGPEGSVYESTLDDVADELTAYVDNEGYTNDILAARDRLEAREIDLIVIFPPDPADTILAGERAVITVIHDKLDPIQQTAVEVASQVAVLELNATILGDIAGAAQEALTPYTTNVVAATELIDEIDAATRNSDVAELERLGAELDVVTDGLRVSLGSTGTLVERLGGSLTETQSAELDRALAAVDGFDRAAATFRDDATRATLADVVDLRARLGDVEDEAELVATLDPDVVTRPFASDAESLLRDRVRPIDFFTPGAIALLLQHMMVTFGAISLVKDRQSGLFETYRVGPIGAAGILGGKFISYLAIGGIVATLLMIAVTGLLDVPLRGDVGWLVLASTGILAGSVALGLVLSMLSGSDSQAVQFAMLTLLAGLFFAGLLLDLDTIRYPVKIVSWMLPMTYGVRVFRDVMLRGFDPQQIDLLGLLGVTALYAGAAWYLLRRRLRTR